MKTTASKIVFVCCVLGCVLGVIGMLTIASIYNRDFDQIIPVEEKNHIIIHESPLIPYDEISSMVVADGMIFLHYDAKGLVNVYNTDGEFQYGLQVKTIPNGAGDIVYIDGKLYVYARGNIIYVFEKTELINIIEFRAGSPENIIFEQYADLFSAEKQNEYLGKTYYLLKSENQVTRVDGKNQFETVIKLPNNTNYSNNAVYMLVLISICLSVMLFIRRGKTGDGFA